VVIKINGSDYRLVLLDTNALSEFRREDDRFRHFLSWSGASPMFVPCFSLFSILEMRRRVDVYERFKEVCRVFPCVLVKSYEQLLDDEVRSYPDPSSINPTLLGFAMLGGEGMDLVRVLDMAFEDESLRDQEKYWNDGAQGIVEGIALRVSANLEHGNSPSKPSISLNSETNHSDPYVLRCEGVIATLGHGDFESRHFRWSLPWDSPRRSRPSLERCGLAELGVVTTLVRYSEDARVSRSRLGENGQLTFDLALRNRSQACVLSSNL
jgi:hypothetical protein